MPNWAIFSFDMEILMAHEFMIKIDAISEMKCRTFRSHSRDHDRQREGERPKTEIDVSDNTADMFDLR